MCFWKFFEIVFSLQLASERATSIGLVLVLFLFSERVRERDTTVFLQHTLAFTHLRDETNLTVHFNTIIALPFLLLFSPFSSYFH